MEIEQPLTDEEKKKLRQLRWSASKNGALLGLKVCLMLLLTNLVVGVLDAFVIHSKFFVFIGSFINSIFIFSYLGRETKKENDRIKKEIKKIFEQE